jgi:hypothetical protein
MTIIDAIVRMHDNRNFRSEIIAAMVEIDEAVNNLLGWGFGLDEERGELLLGLLRDVDAGISKKLRILERLLKARHPDIAGDCLKWIKQVRKLNTFRTSLLTAGSSIVRTTDTLCPSLPIGRAYRFAVGMQTGLRQRSSCHSRRCEPTSRKASAWCTWVRC